MVAISLYRGNLHRVPDVPRRWLMPSPKVTLKDFKSLLKRRSRALSRLHQGPTPTTTTTPASTKPNSKDNNGTPIPPPQLEGEEKLPTTNREAEEAEQTSKGEPPQEEPFNDQGQSDGGVSLAKPDGLSNSKPEEAEKGAEAVSGDANLPPEKPGQPTNPNTETNSKDDVLSDKEKRRREVEEKLQVLNAKKHSLVQALKQILNAEEELKRRNSMQGMAIRPSIPLQVDVTNDTGSMTRHITTPRMGLETNLGGDMEGGENEDVSNHNIHSRNIHRMSSTSPSESPLRRPPHIQHNVVPHPSRSSLLSTGSPSRFAPMGHQGNPANLPAVSVSGTNYIASSPSPAASGGTSAFRDARQPSPWN